MESNKEPDKNSNNIQWNENLVKKEEKPLHENFEPEQQLQILLKKEKNNPFSMENIKPKFNVSVPIKDFFTLAAMFKGIEQQRSQQFKEIEKYICTKDFKLNDSLKWANLHENAFTRFNKSAKKFEPIVVLTDVLKQNKQSKRKNVVYFNNGKKRQQCFYYLFDKEDNSEVRCILCQCQVSKQWCIRHLSKCHNIQKNFELFFDYTGRKYLEGLEMKKIPPRVK